MLQTDIDRWDGIWSSTLQTACLAFKLPQLMTFVVFDLVWHKLFPFVQNYFSWLLSLVVVVFKGLAACVTSNGSIKT